MPDRALITNEYIVNSIGIASQDIDLSGCQSLSKELKNPKNQFLLISVYKISKVCPLEQQQQQP